jgi:MFS family permease
VTGFVVSRRNPRSGGPRSGRHVTLGPAQVLRRHGDFRRIIIASAVSDMGTWMQLMTVGTLVAHQTGSALRSGLVAVATFSPQILTAPIGGALADRYDRRMLLRVILALQTVAAGALALAVADGFSPTALTLMVLAQGLLTSMANPVFGSIVPDLVPSDSLLAASSLSVVAWNAGRIAGPIAATVLIRTVGPAFCIAANAVSFAVLFAVVSLLRRSFAPAATDVHESIGARFAHGLRALRSVQTIRFALLFACVSQVLLAPLIGLIPILADKRLGGAEGTASLLYVALGTGSLLGSWAVASLVRRFGRTRTALCLNGGSTLMFLLCAQMTSARAVATIMMPLGVCFIGGFVCVNSVIQRDAPAGERGRILSIMSAGIGLSYSIGVIWIGVLSDAVSIHLALTAAAVVALLAFTLSVALQRPRWRSLGFAD